jgi:acetolactate synthase I/II/III large subunit
VPGGTELYMGTAALSERDYVHEAIEQADVIITIGHDTVEKPPFLMGTGGPQVIHVGYQPAHVEQVYFPQTEVIGDLGPSLRLLADRVEGKIANAQALLPLREGILARIAARATEPRLIPQRLVHDVRAVMPRDGILALDNGMYKIWFARNYRTGIANTLLLDHALATMGAGLPSGIMAALLHPERRVMAICGDGGFMMNSQELETAVRLKLDLVVLVIEDGAFGMIRWKQATDHFHDFGLVFGNPDFVAYAQAYGAKGTRVSSVDELHPTLEAAFAGGGVHLVVVPVDYSESACSWTNCASASRLRPRPAARRIEADARRGHLNAVLVFCSPAFQNKPADCGGATDHGVTFGGHRSPRAWPMSLSTGGVRPLPGSRSDDPVTTCRE